MEARVVAAMVEMRVATEVAHAEAKKAAESTELRSTCSAADSRIVFWSDRHRDVDESLAVRARHPSRGGLE